MTDYLELARTIASRAAADGIEVEVIITESKETEIEVEGGNVEKLSQAGSRGMGVRAINGGKTGYAYTSDFSDESIEQTWKTAIELSQVATADEFRKLPEPEAIPDEDLRIYDAALAELPVTEKVDFIKRVEQAALDFDERVFLTSNCSYFDSISHTYLANSKGFAESFGRTTCGSFLSAIARDEGGMVNAIGFGASNYFNELNAEAIGQQAARKAVSILGGQPIPTQTASVVLDHFVGAQILYAYAQALSAENWQRSRSFLMGKMGEEVGSSMVTLMDNGRLPGGMASAPFDGEGVPTKATRLIDEGVLQAVMYDSYTAAKEGKISTGNAGRNGHRSMPTLASSNFYMQPGHKSPEEIIKGVEKGLYVISVMQTGGIDPVSGDCSMSANGLWIEDGEIQQAVGGVTIATTLGDLLRNISDVGNDLQQIPFFGSLGVPTLRVDNITIGGVDA
ncbi:MAG: TldD/PmbA family protein [Anaerolineae bacterium]|nr:TldD/PmbA family protein [Anaerolineae bacterium]